MSSFTIFPAIDLRRGQVVRLSQGNPDQQKIYSTDPVHIAHSMFKQGADWLHVVNLDGAFGDPSDLNMAALSAIIHTAQEYGKHIEFGGGLHTLDQVRSILSSGIDRAILGSMAVREPENVRILMNEFPAERVAVSLDSRNQKVMLSGWQEASGMDVFDLAENLKTLGLEWLVYTDIDRDGMQTGSDFHTTVSLARKTGLKIIASGGVSTCKEVELLKNNGIAGAILGRALYEGTIDLAELLKLECKGNQ